MEFWNSNKKEYKKNVLIVPNYTYFGDDKDINRDSFIVVFKAFIDNCEGYEDVKWILPYPAQHIPTSLLHYDNVDLRQMANVSTFPPLMRVQFPSSFFRKVLTNERIDLIWSHLPEWTNRLLIARRYTSTQEVIGYCHWWELKDNGGYTYNSFVDNINGILKMRVCGVNSQWVKDLVIKRASEIFNKDVTDRLEHILKPWYLGTDTYQPAQIKNGIPTFLFNHRINEYTGGDWFFDTMDKFWEDGYQFKVYVTSSNIRKPYVENVGASDRETYLENISKATIGVGAFNKYSAWSVSVTDGLSAGVPYLLPNDLCYREMVGEDYPLYKDRNELRGLIEGHLKGEVDYSDIDLKAIVDKLNWQNTIKKWNVIDYM